MKRVNKQEQQALQKYKNSPFQKTINTVFKKLDKEFKKIVEFENFLSANHLTIYFTFPLKEEKSCLSDYLDLSKPFTEEYTYFFTLKKYNDSKKRKLALFFEVKISKTKEIVWSKPLRETNLKIRTRFCKYLNTFIEKYFEHIKELTDIK